MWGYLAAGLFAFWLYKCEQFKATPIVRNPRRRGKRNPETLTPADKTALAKAESIAEEFHGEAGYRQVVELTPRERKLPRFCVSLGQLPQLQYEPDRGSKRAGYVYVHESGDKGWLGPKSKQKPLLCVDPTTRRPLLVAMRSPMRMESDKGLVG